MRVVVEEVVKNPSAFGQHVILPRLLSFLGSAPEENLGGVEAVHVPFENGVEAVDLVELSGGEVAVVDFDGGNGSLEELLPGPLVGAVGFRLEKGMKLGDANGLANAHGVVAVVVLEKRSNLVDLAGSDHAIHTCGERGVEDREGDVDPEEQTVVAQPKVRVVVDQGVEERVGTTGNDGQAVAFQNGGDGEGGVAAEVVGSEINVGLDSA